ncbi:MAG: hypothetical protein QME96_14340 [Myxococcota bacterium]|nr:hypothetical protein [Myxococcota bacterium]
MKNDDHRSDADGGTDLAAELDLPGRPRLPVVSLALAVVFLCAGGLLLYLVRNEIAYFMASAAPEQKLAPTKAQPVPHNARSNVLAEARIDHKDLCDYWDPTVDIFRPDESYAFTLQMGLGDSYFMTCAGDGSSRPRLWILKPETPEESRRINQEARRRHWTRTTLDASIQGPVPEIHVPGGTACVNDLCRGRLVRFGEYAANAFAGVGGLRETLAARLPAELERTGAPPLRDDDFLLILGETPRDKWWYVALVCLIVGLSALNLALAIRFLGRWLRARREAPVASQ